MAMTKNQQKKIVMIVLGIIAVVLCVIQLRPVFTGYSPVADPSSPAARAAASGAQEARSEQAPAPGRQRRPATRREKDEADRPPLPGEARRLPEITDLPLDVISIDLSKIERRIYHYETAGLRSPFAPAEFEEAQRSSRLKKMDLTLQGIVTTPHGVLAIIDNRVFTEGDSVAEGVVVKHIGANSVVLTDGQDEVRLALDQRPLRGGGR